MTDAQGHAAMLNRQYAEHHGIEQVLSMQQVSWTNDEPHCVSLVQQCPGLQ